MKIAAIICEYNPFHNGHKYQIDATRERVEADAIIAVMSGNFVQRGDVAVFDKRLRADAAISGGVDLVIELPTLYSTASAEIFASRAVHIVQALGLVDVLSFGAETSDATRLSSVAEILAAETLDFKKSLLKNLKTGVSYPVARQMTVRNFLGDDFASLLSTPNNILAIEYLKELLRLKSDITPIAVRRKGVNHDEPSTTDRFASASQIRHMLTIDDVNVNNFTPFDINNTIHNISSWEKAIIANLRKMSKSDLAEIADVTEGLENRIKKLSFDFDSLEALLDAVKCKRYTHSRLRRIALNSYLGITKELQRTPPPYVKILHFNDVGQRIINLVKKTSSLPVIKNASQVKKLVGKDALTFWERELMFDSLYEIMQ